MKLQGIILTILSAIIFGFTPIIGRLTYEMGSNGVTLGFYRYLFSLPVLFFISSCEDVSIKVDKIQMKGIFRIGLGVAVTTILLYSSYSYIGVGTATTLHFMYPLMVSFGTVVFYKESIKKSQIICLLLCTAGMAGFLEGGVQTGFRGILMSFLSSISFAYYMVGFERFGVKDIAPSVFTFHMSWIVLAVIGLYGFVSKSLILVLPLRAYGYSLLVALLASVAGAICLQAGIRRLGASTAAVFSTFEPITSVVIGIFVLAEELSIIKLGGCCCILGGITYLIVTDRE